MRSTTLLWPLVALLATSCAVYVPMQGAAPDVRQRGEAEVTAAWSGTNRFDAAVAYSPLPHVLARAAGSFKGKRPTPGDSSTASLAQYELALGTYWPLGRRWTVGGLAGFGQLYPDARYFGDGNDVGIFRRSSRLHVIAGRYHKYMGELYANFQASSRVSLGLSYRLTQLHLGAVADLGVPVQSAPILRGEPTLLLRVSPAAASGRARLQLALGTSHTLGYNSLTAYDQADPARQYKLPQAYLMVGVALYPHAWGRREEL